MYLNKVHITYFNFVVLAQLLINQILVTCRHIIHTCTNECVMVVAPEKKIGF